MKNYGFGKNLKNKGYLADSDWELAEEISPDPFSEEEHTIIHARRFSRERNNRNLKNKENNSKNEK
jgi:hypothetical protein